MSRISDLTYALHQKTSEKKLRWEVQDDTTISTNIGKNSVIITILQPNALAQNTVSRVYVQNIDGVIVDQEEFFSHEMEHSCILEIMTRARRDSLRADETLDEIMDRVNRL